MNMVPEITTRAFTNDQLVLDRTCYSNFYRIKTLPEDCVMMDVGAHCGYFAMTCAMKGAKRIYCYEPYKPNYEMLLKNIEPFRAVVIPFNQGIWNSHAIIKIAHPDTEDKFFDFNYIKLATPETKDFDQGFFSEFDHIVGALPEQPNFLKLNTRNYDIDLLKSSTEIEDFEYICGEAFFNGPSDITTLIESMKEKGFEQSFFKADEEQNTNQFVFGKDKLKTETIFDLYA